jgi:signal transduction histidine kinase/CheY-like chemotaxis protein
VPLRRHSLRWRLPAFFCALIVAMLAAFLWTTYREVESTVVRAGRQRAQTGAEQVAGMLERSVKARLDENDTLRVDPELRAYLRSPTPETREAARKDITPSRPFRRVELWNTAGSLVLEAATPHADSAAGPRFLPRGAAPVREEVSEIRAAGNTNFFDVVVAIRDGPSPTAPSLGYLRRFGSITSTPGGNVRRLIGDEATVKIGSAKGAVWTDFYSIVDAPPLTNTPSDRGDDRAADGRRWVGASAAVEGSPWVVWVGFPRALIVEPIRPFMRRMMVLGLLFVAVGMVLVVMLGVRLTQPLHALARAAEEIAAGDYTQRVSTGRRDEIGRLSDAFNTMTDRIDEAHGALRESHEQTHFALASARIGVWESHLATGRMSCSDSMRSVLRLPAGALPQTRDAFLALVHPDDRESVRHGLEGRGADEVFDVRCRALEPDGSIRWLEGKGRMKMDEARRPVSVLGVSVDVTEQRELEAQFRQSQKMEAVGQLAGGVAHDFNNLLAAIMSYSELLLEDLPSDSTARSDVSEIHAAAGRAAALTRQLLAYSRKQLLQPAVVDLATVAEQMASMLGRLLGPDIELETRAPRQPWAVLADPGQMEQVVVNLAVNARDAMPNGGRLSIDIINVTLPAGAFPWVSAAGDYVVLAMTDTGIGMSEATQAKIFDPFFTTKEAGKGTGLGLSTVYGIVKQSGGHITVESELGRGTTFKCYFPRHSEPYHLAPASSPASAPSRASRRESGHELVLVIDDEPAIRSAVARILTRQGYAVLEAGEPAIARQLASEHAGAIDLIVADIMLPGMNGRELVDELLTVQPRARTLFMSGFSDDTVKLQGLLEQGAPFLAKPFALDDVVRKVRDMLARGKGSGAGVASAC